MGVRGRGPDQSSRPVLSRFVASVGAQTDSVSLSCVPSSGGLSDSPAPGLSSVLPPMLLLLCFSLE